ncbi:MAG: glycosyltransferase family 4 protein [Propionibacteriaceae bacterium]|nr:glycosyltransferase family 4 protein [Propionibacteriaceae bacterium]
MAELTMRIVYLHQYFKTPSMQGGTRSFEFARRLADEGYDVQMVTSDTSEDAPPGWTVEKVSGFTVHWLKVPYSNKQSFNRRIIAFLSFAVGAAHRSRSLRGDLIFATSTPLTIILPVLWASLFRSSPLVFEVRDLWPELPIAVGALRHPLAIALSRYLEKIAYKKADQIVALSPGMQSGILARGIPPDRVTVIPNSSDVDLFHPQVEPRDWSQDCPELVGKKVVLYGGTLGFINGVDYLAEVAAIVKDTHKDVAFLVIGDGSQQQQIAERARHLGVMDVNFFMRPAFTKNEMPSVLASCKVATSLFLPIPEMEANSANKFFDALAAGKPVIINYGGWQKNVLESAQAGMSVSASPQESATEIVQLLEDEDRLESMSRNSRHLAETVYSRDKLFLRLLSVLRSVLK